MRRALALVGVACWGGVTYFMDVPTPVCLQSPTGALGDTVMCSVNLSLEIMWLYLTFGTENPVAALAWVPLGFFLHPIYVLYLKPPRV